MKLRKYKVTIGHGFESKIAVNHKDEDEAWEMLSNAVYRWTGNVAYIDEIEKYILSEDRQSYVINPEWVEFKPKRENILSKSSHVISAYDNQYMPS